jgi:hypothetical protein
LVGNAQQARPGFLPFVLAANVWGWINVPDFPSADDWGLKLTLSK